MNYLTADQLLMERLAGVMEPIEIRDPDGRILGRYTPVFSDDQEAQERAAKYFNFPEAERSLREKSQGSALAEIWERLRATENQG
jgi:hypothetical protein